MIEQLYQPRLRMFAGPNGSGKSTMKSVLQPELLGHYVNADDIEKEIKKNAWLDLRSYDIKCSKSELIEFYKQSTLLAKSVFYDEITLVGFDENKYCISFHNIEINSYWAAVTADFIRYQLLKKRQSFTFETVMSSPDKIVFLAKAKELGYKTYLYYVATEDVNINIKRVQNRVFQGGHNVPKGKIESRYERSLDLLLDAIKCTDRAYIFDNSGECQIWIAEITNGTNLELKIEGNIPTWFQKHIIKKQ
jgi:predicted ABC-type ATPase